MCRNVTGPRRGVSSPIAAFRRCSSHRPAAAPRLAILTALLAAITFGTCSGSVREAFGQPGPSQGLRLRAIGARADGRTFLYLVVDLVTVDPIQVPAGGGLFLGLPGGLVHLKADSVMRRHRRICESRCLNYESAAYPISETELRALAQAETVEIIVMGSRQSAMARAGPIQLLQIRSFVTRFLAPVRHTR